MQKSCEISPENQNTAVSLGFFDGLHNGHRSVILHAVRQGREGLLPVCLTFSQNPKSIISGCPQNALMTETDKLSALEALGMERTIFADFGALRNMTAESFFYDILLKKLKVKKLFCGFNYRFGKNGAGDARLLKKLCSENGAEAYVLPAERENGKIISSSLIREMITEGDVKNANRLLYRDFGFSAVIEHGAKLGRTLGTPTINQKLLPQLVVPKFGVYASAVTLENGEKYCGVTNIGVRPTVGGSAAVCETWMPRYSGGEIYGQTADIRLASFIRPERKFGSVEELGSQIKADGKAALGMLKEPLIK